ncbi:MAG: hypothetical protein KKA22_03145 [Gammaproteobacteria bacterium]|nr:hypothetical protein [Gammaproteobacteria bacterium]MBU1407127.1 hypothetical protein [Gammaproteobacteria bacterium]
MDRARTAEAGAIQFVQFAGVLDAFRGHTVWVHCARNMRVSAFVYLYRRLVLSEDEAAASFPMREVWAPDPVWQAFIDQVLQVKPQEAE